MKKKILIIAVAACLLALTIAGTSVAYFTDTDAATNVFTVGEVDIKLTEAKVTVDSQNWHIVKVNPEERVASTGIDYKNIRTLWPGQSIAKDPRIDNVGSENAYVGAVITITNDNGANGTANIANSLAQADVTSFIVGLPQNAAINVKPIVENGVTVGYTVYVLFADAVVAGTGTATVFTGLAIPATWGNTEMKNLENLNVTVNAYATQTAGFANSTEAMNAAFPGTFVLN